MRRKVKKYIMPFVKFNLTYGVVILVAMQVLANIVVLVPSLKHLYYENSFIINFLVGNNLYVSVFLMMYAFYFRFCYASRAAAVAELLFAINYMIVKDDNLYNMLFQIIVGTISIIWVLRTVYKTKPLCQFSLLVELLKSITKQKGDCDRAIDGWDSSIKKHIKNRQNIGSAH